MSSDINVQTFSGKVNINNNLLVGSSHLFVDTVNNRVGITTADPDAGLHVNSNAYVHTDFRVGSGIVMNDTTGQITAGSFVGDGSGLDGINSDSGSWVNGTGNVYLSTTTDKVGIGTTDPTEKIHIKDGSIRLDSTGTVSIINKHDTSDYGVLSLDAGYRGGSSRPKIRIVGYQGQASVNGDNLITFHTNGSERMKINQSGNVGIGTTSPSQKFVVVGDSAIIHSNSADTHNTSDRTLYIGGREVNGSLNQSKCAIVSTPSTSHGGAGQYGRNALHFCVGPDAQNNTNASKTDSRMCIDYTGNVGIGTTDPTRNLDVGTTGSIGFGDNIGATTERGLYWSNGADYAIYRTNGNWSSPDYQQLLLKWSTGIVLQTARGTFGRSHVGVDDRMSIGASYYTTKSPTNGLIVEGNVGIGTTGPGEKLEINAGRVKITDSGGGTAANSSAGTLTLRHQNNNGSSSIVFPSVGNAGSDYAWIEYDEDGGEGGEAAKLKIGITNDHNDDIMLQTSGGVGITSGTPTSVYHPFGKLEIQDPPSNSGVNNYRCYQSWKYGSGMWAIAVDNVTGTNHNLYWYGTNNTSGNLQKILGFENDTANRGTAGIFAFTGQHRNIVTINPTSIESCIGLIVSANNNENIKVQGGVERGLNAIEINETLPLLSITNTAKDKSVFGVISGSEDPDSRVNKVGRVSNYYDKESGDDRVIINSLGEGALWITNANGPLESGDYITSSHIPGYGMKQDSDFLANYTVAKITMDCDFQATPRVKYTIKKELKTLIGYKSEHCLITETEYENIERDYEKAKYTRQERDENVNILDEHGQLQWEDSGETEAPYKVRYLLPDGTQISEEEYTTGALSNEEVYIAAFVGCTYHCG